MDGGYYAIKGFEYQIDKTLFEVMTSVDGDTVICLEQIQDINTDDFVMQVKYKEATKLTPSVIRKPIIQLINEFNLDPSKNYVLYCFFGDTNGYTETVDLDFLNKVLGTEGSNFATLNKEQFLKKFKLSFSEDFQSQFQNVLTKLQEQSFCNSKDEAVFYYCILEDYLRKKVVNHPPANMANRKVTKNELLGHLQNGRKIIATSGYKEFLGDEAFFRIVKSKFKKPVKNQNNIIVCGDVIEETLDLGNLIYQIIKKHFTKATYDVQPITFVVPDGMVGQVKQILIQENSYFNDGYESIQFSESIFLSKPIIYRNKSNLSQSSFYSRIISKSNFDSITELNFNPNWTFISSEIHPLVNSTNYQILNNLSTNELLKLF